MILQKDKIYRRKICQSNYVCTGEYIFIELA